MRLASGELHLVGARPERGTHRVSSAVVDLDVINRVGVTSSGRRYVLAGDPATEMDEESRYVWLAWCHANHVIEFRDITNGLIFDAHVTAQHPRSTPH